MSVRVRLAVAPVASLPAFDADDLSRVSTVHAEQQSPVDWRHVADVSVAAVRIRATWSEAEWRALALRQFPSLSDREAFVSLLFPPTAILDNMWIDGRRRAHLQIAAGATDIVLAA